MQPKLAIPLLLFGFSMTLFAQGGIQQTAPPNDAAITSETQVDTPTLHRWLHSGDPRLIAWAADFARRNHDATIIAELPNAFEQMIIPAAWGTIPAEHPNRLAALAVLDTLIQEKADVPLPLINRISAALPAQAAILLTQKPLKESRDLLESWTLGERMSYSNPTLARIATMLLAKDPQQSKSWGEHWQRIGLVASVVDDSEEELYIVLRAEVPNSGYGSGGGSCGDSFGKEPTPGWPVVYSYGLNEANQQAGYGSIVVDLDGDEIYSVRNPESAAGGSCAGQEVLPLNAETRHRLLAYWLGVPEKEMTWQPHEVETIIWTDQGAYENNLGKIVDLHRRNLEATVKALEQKGLLKENDQVIPKLSIRIKCAITPCPIQ